ncbi:MAG: transposase [Pedobacter sp.]
MLFYVLFDQIFDGIRKTAFFLLLPLLGSTAKEVAQVYKLRWNIETFFGCWKRHLKVYHLIAWSKYGLMVQLLGGLITYLLLAIYYRKQHNEPVSISRVQELRHQIANEVAEPQSQRTLKSVQSNKIRRLKQKRRHAKT